jgi:hypothetical protein
MLFGKVEWEDEMWEGESAHAEAKAPSRKEMRAEP